MEIIKINEERMNQVLPQTVKDSNLSTSAKKILATIINYYSMKEKVKETGFLAISNEDLRQSAEVGKEYLILGIQELIECRLISRVAGSKRKTGERSKASVYYLNKENLLKPIVRPTPEELLELIFNTPKPLSTGHSPVNANTEPIANAITDTTTESISTTESNSISTIESDTDIDFISDIESDSDTEADNESISDTITESEFESAIEPNSIIKSQYESMMVVDEFLKSANDELENVNDFKDLSSVGGKLRELASNSENSSILIPILNRLLKEKSDALKVAMASAPSTL